MKRARRMGARRARAQSEAAGAEVARARAALGLSRLGASRLAGISPDTQRRIEEGDPAIQLDTLCAAGEAVGMDIVVRIYPGREPALRDSGQLGMADHLCQIAHASLQSSIEVPAGDHGEACDIVFMSPIEILATEINRLLLDFQDRYRRNDQKRRWLAARHQRPVRLVMVVEDTPRNRRAVAPHARFIASVLPAGTREVLGALRSGQPLGRDGLVWIRPRALPRA